MTIALPIDEALEDPNLLGAALGDITSWRTWTTTLRAASGLRLDMQQSEIFNLIAGGRPPPAHRVSELWCLVGRGGGKSRMAAGVGVHCALLQPHRLSAGEIGHVLVLSPSLAQSKVIFGYARGFIEQSPVLRREIEGMTATEIRLRNNVVIAVHPNSFRSVRGRTLLACVFDECAFWRSDESANPDIETYRAVLPSLVRAGGQLIGISTPYRRMGLLFQKHRDHFGVPDDSVLVVQGASTLFNPCLSEAEIAKVSASDPEAAISEWQGEFRSDIGAFLAEPDIDACVDHDRPRELPPRGEVTYYAFCDPSGGRHDAMTLAIGHRHSDRVVIDVLRGAHPPFDPAEVTREFAALLREYRIREVIGDAYAAQWTEEAFKMAGIRYQRSELPKGRLYVEGLPAFTRRTLSLPDNPRLLRELRLLERRTHVGGKDSVDHGRVGSDDYANAVFGVLHYAQKRRQRMLIGTYGYGGPVTWRDPATGEVIDPKTNEPIRRTNFRVVHVREQEAPAARGLVGGKLGA